MRINAADPGIEIITPDALGADELLAEGVPVDEMLLRVYARACRELEITSAAVPSTFPLELADRLRAEGIDVQPDRELFDLRRRSKNATRSRASAARSARARPRSTSRGRCCATRRANGTLVLDGEPLTCERIRMEVERIFGEHGAFADEFIVSHGAQTAIGHESGHGAILAGEPIVFDLFPRDRATGVFTDMTRTYVVGEPPAEIAEWHRALQGGARPRRRRGQARRQRAHADEDRRDLFEEHGHPTQFTKKPGEVLDSGFFHSLGHGVGLEVHEHPYLSRVGDDLVAGRRDRDRAGALPPGLGGVRLEDIAIVTADGIDVVTDYPYELAP